LKIHVFHDDTVCIGEASQIFVEELFVPIFRVYSIPRRQLTFRQ